MKTKSRLLNNIPKNYLFLGLQFTDLTRGLWMIWLYIQGFSLLQIGFLEGIFHITSFLMEIPTGLIADIYGRKSSRLLGRVLFTFSLLILFFSHQFWLQALGFVFTALGYNLESGAGEALVYDSLKECGRENLFKKVGGWNNGIIEAAMLLGTLTGGWLATRQGYSWVFYPSMILGVLSFLVILTMKEPTLAREEQQRLRSMHPFLAIVHQTKESLKVIKERPRIAFLILFTELISMFGATSYFYLQTWWKSQGWTEWRIGLCLGLGGVLSILGGLTAEKIEKRIGEKKLLMILPSLMVLALWGIGFSGIDWLAYSLTGWILGILYVVIQDYLNRMIPSERRASVLSFQSMAFSFYMILLFPLVGWVGDTWDLQWGFRALAGIAMLLLIPFLLIYRRH